MEMNGVDQAVAVPGKVPMTRRWTGPAGECGSSAVGGGAERKRFLRGSSQLLAQPPHY